MPILYTWMRNPFCNFAFVLHWAIFPFNLTIVGLFTFSVRLVSYGCTRKVAKQECLVTSQVHPWIDGRTLTMNQLFITLTLFYQVSVSPKLMASLYPCISVASLCRQRASIRVLMMRQIARDFCGFVVTIHNIYVLQQCKCTDIVGRKSCVMEGLKFEDGQRWKKDKCTVCDCKVSSFTK